MKNLFFAAIILIVMLSMSKTGNAQTTKPINTDSIEQVTKHKVDSIEKAIAAKEQKKADAAKAAILKNDSIIAARAETAKRNKATLQEKRLATKHRTDSIGAVKKKEFEEKNKNQAELKEVKRKQYEAMEEAKKGKKK